MLAEVDGVAIGFALFFYNYSTWQGRCIYLEDLYVDESARGTGTGTLLLKTVAAIAHAEGCKRMSWQALDWFVCGVLVVMGRGDGAGMRERARSMPRGSRRAPGVGRQRERVDAVEATERARRHRRYRESAGRGNNENQTQAAPARELGRRAAAARRPVEE